MTTEAYTETSAEVQTDAVSDAADGGTPVWAFLISAVIAMSLIYIVTVYLPKIAAMADRLIGRDKKEEVPVKAEDYKVNDIYEMRKDDDSKPE